MWTIALPLAVAVSKKKNFILNFNRYRNAHFQVLAKAKEEFSRLVSPLLGCVPQLSRCSLEYVYYSGKGTPSDTNNVCAVHDKFFADVLVSTKRLKDDGPRHLTSTLFRYGGRDVARPRVEVTIRTTEVSLPGRTAPMKITAIATITPAEAQEALRDLMMKKSPMFRVTKDTQFLVTPEGSYEARVEIDLASLGQVPAALENQPAKHSGLPPPVEAPASPSPAPKPAQKAEEPAPVKQETPKETVKASAQTPDAPPPKKSLFEDDDGPPAAQQREPSVFDSMPKGNSSK